VFYTESKSKRHKRALGVRLNGRVGKVGFEPRFLEDKLPYLEPNFKREAREGHIRHIFERVIVRLVVQHSRVIDSG
jgi:hypothetical protein